MLLPSCVQRLRGLALRFLQATERSLAVRGQGAELLGLTPDAHQGQPRRKRGGGVACLLQRRCADCSDSGCEGEWREEPVRAACRLWGFPDDPKCTCGFATWEQKHGFPGLRLGVARLGSSSFKTGIQLSFVSSAVQRGQCGSKARVASTPSPAHEQSGKRCFCKGVCKALSFYS